MVPKFRRLKGGHPGSYCLGECEFASSFTSTAPELSDLVYFFGRGNPPLGGCVEGESSGQVSDGDAIWERSAAQAADEARGPLLEENSTDVVYVTTPEGVSSSCRLPVGR